MASRTDRALSPVIGGVLLIAIVVVLAAVAGGVALSLTEEREPAPEVRVAAETTDDGYTQRLRHEQGDVIDGDKVTLRGTANPEQLAGQELGAGDSVDFYPLKEEISLVWAGDHGATYSLATFEIERPLPVTPDEGCSWVSTNSSDGTEDVDVDGIAVNCDVQTNKTIEIYNGGTVIGDTTSNNKFADIDNGDIYGDVEVEKDLNIQDGKITGSVVAHTENIKIETSTVGGDITAEEKAIEVLDGSSVGGDLLVSDQNLIKIQSSSVSGSVTTDGEAKIADATVGGDVTSGNKPLTVSSGSSVDGDLESDDDINVQSSTVSGSVVTDGTVKLDGATIEGDVYAGTFDCTDSTIDGQDCGSYTPKDPDDW